MSEIREVFERNRICVLVPTYNNARTLDGVLTSLLEYTDQIVVVNDGSTDETANIIAHYPQIKNFGYPDNRGKGYALQFGFKNAMEAGYKYAITMDSDGQHFAKDLPVFLNKLTDNPDAIIIGARNMDQASVPGKSSFGNKFSNFWFQVETGLKLKDTQSGYRLYPISSLQKFNFYTNKFEFEIEVLVRSAWGGIQITEVPVQVFYAEKSERVSHFRPFRDFSRISVLNTVLVTIALLYIKPRDLVRKFKKKSFKSVLTEALFNNAEPDTVKALSVGFGVFMGIVPIWGFQLAAAIALAFAFKLNKALVIIAANISIPPMIPLILFLSHVTGTVWMGDEAVSITFDRALDLDFFKDSFLQYVYGAITLAIAAGVIFSVVTYSLLKFFRR
jgi:glycosyltransferase involved in cell wall biosynthesis